MAGSVVADQNGAEARRDARSASATMRVARSALMRVARASPSITVAVMAPMVGAPPHPELPCPPSRFSTSAPRSPFCSGEIQGERLDLAPQSLQRRRRRVESYAELPSPTVRHPSGPIREKPAVY